MRVSKKVLGGCSMETPAMFQRGDRICLSFRLFLSMYLSSPLPFSHPYVSVFTPRAILKSWWSKPLGDCKKTALSVPSRLSCPGCGVKADLLGWPARLYLSRMRCPDYHVQADLSWWPSPADLPRLPWPVLADLSRLNCPPWPTFTGWSVHVDLSSLTCQADLPLLICPIYVFCPGRPV